MLISALIHRFLTPPAWLPAAVVLLILALVVIALIREWASPDITTMTAFAVLVILGLLPMDRAYQVFSNPAPITIAALFILSEAMAQTGLIDWLGDLLAKVVSRHLWLTLPPLMFIAAAAAAFVHNTSVVAVFMPVLLAICRKKHVSASKLLLPLSYAAALGGACTLIGTATNLVVNGVAVDHRLPALGMFEFTPMGLILLGAGIAYVAVCGPWLLPDRQGLAAILSAQERRQYLCHVLVKPTSPLVGQALTGADLADLHKGFRIIEVRRGGSRLTLPLNEVVIHPYDRVLLAVSSKNMERASVGGETLKSDLLAALGIENLSTIKGAILEGIVAPHSRLIGKSLGRARFRQTYGMLVLGLHRGGKNLSDFPAVELEFGDSLLLLGPVSTFSQLRDEGDFMLLEDATPPRYDRPKAIASVIALAGVVVATAFHWTPIVFAATVACLFVLWLRCLSPQQAYKSIDWTVIVMLYGMLAIGQVMERSGAAGWIAKSAVEGAQLFVPQGWRRYVILSAFYFLGGALGEVLAHSATALVLAPIAISTAQSLGLDPRPFLFAIAFSASTSFATPFATTNMMVYGAGGYRFLDVLRFGLPLNLLLWGVASYFLPHFWPLRQL